MFVALLAIATGIIDKTIPRRPPIADSTADSVRKLSIISLLVAPRVKYIPISCLRSIACDIIVFIMPMPATTIAIPAMELINRVRGVSQNVFVKT
jgi:hypothetical protein